MNTFLFRIIAGFLMISGALTNTTFGARLFFDTAYTSMAPRQDFVVNVLVNTEGQSINAVQGEIEILGQSVNVSKINSGDSVINFWIEDPHKSMLKNQTHTRISFSGIATAGFSKEKSPLFSFVINASEVGDIVLNTSSLKILKNNGTGQDVEVTTVPLTLSVAEGSTIITTPRDDQDIAPPEDFVPIVSNEVGMFDGKYFLIFATQDKGSGIDRYEIKEGEWGAWTSAESPFLLSDQSLTSDLYIKAVDGAQNSRIVKINAKNHPKWYQQNINIAIIIIFVLIGLLICTKTNLLKKYF